MGPVGEGRWIEGHPPPRLPSLLNGVPLRQSTSGHVPPVCSLPLMLCLYRVALGAEAGEVVEGVGSACCVVGDVVDFSGGLAALLALVVVAVECLGAEFFPLPCRGSGLSSLPCHGGYPLPVGLVPLRSPGQMPKTSRK